MCGIVATFGENHQRLVLAALQKIKHRGHDSSKTWSDNYVSFGFNRLAINGTSEVGNQPFEFKNYVGVFNGEIYNHQLLKQQFDLTLKSQSDMEVILPLFDKLGENILEQLDGFYSGIIYNKNTQQTWLLRDYIGKKPLFLGENYQNRFITSELKAIENLQSFQIVPKGLTEVVNNTLSVISKHANNTYPKSELKNSLLQAVKKRLPTDGKTVGVFLSGGLDSSIIAYLVSSLTNNAIYYTLGDNEDSDFVNILAEKLNITAQLRKVSTPSNEQLPTLINKVVYHTESYNPSIISNGLATYLLSKQAFEDGLKVVLSGEGADELFCGYKLPNHERLENRKTFIDNMHVTELRRLDLASMSQTIEVRCPFLDRSIFFISNDCNLQDLIVNNQGKKILREAYSDNLPQEIINRKKVSFDVGSGLRKLVVEYLTKDGLSERQRLKKIWNGYFNEALASNPHFHSYPIFNELIEKRGISHK